MPSLDHWSEGELEAFSHKLEEIIHGPSGVDGSIGFIFIAYPIANISKAKLLSNSDRQMVIEVMYQCLKGLTQVTVQ